VITMRKVIYTDKAPKPLAKYSQGIRVGSLIFVSGQVAIDPETGKLIKGDIKAQTRRVLENIKAILEAEGASLKDVIKVTVYLADKKLYKEFNEVYGEYFSEDPPARTTVEAKPPAEDTLIEMDVIAYIE